MTIDQHPTIAIVGAGGIFPRAGNLSAFWHNIVSCENAIRPVPPERWPVDVDQVYAATAAPDKARSLNAGLITSFTFNPEGLALGPETVAHLDPMHHLVLEAGRSAWHDSRHAPVDPQRVDVILAAIALPTNAASRLTRQVLRTAAELKLFKGDGGQSPPVLSPHEAIASCVTSLPAALLSAALDLGGGTLTLDAACASSLFAIKLGCDRLQAGRADAVLAGGVARPDALYTQIGFTQLQALSPSGRCAPFDRSADGLVVGEGCGMLVLKRLDDALAHGDTIYALIRGAGVSNDMRGNLLAPDSEGQLRAMRMAYAAAGWRPTEVDLIECHGAGTPVGDATELRSLNRLWGRAGWQTGQCAIGSIKSMIGHLLTAAGSAGLIKVLLGLRHGVLPPSLNFNHAAPDSPLQESPFHIPTRPSPWELRDGDTPRRAAVSAFGFGGINAHLLVEEWRPPAKAAAATVTPVATTPEGRSAVTGEPIALVGMEALFAPVPGLRAFQETVFRGRSAFQPPENGRWKQCGHLLQHFLKRDQPLPGAYLNDFQIDLSEFRIPPKEIPDILPQHLLMLKAALGAMADAGLDTHQENTRMGCIIGMEFDLEDTNFHLRWDTQKVAWQWNARFSLDLSRDQIAAWARSLADAYAPPLTHTRTLGSLGSLIASRIARELRFGGPSFIVSSEAASGLQALALAGQMLQRREVDHMLVGAVDLPGDLRRLIRDERLQLLSSGDTPHCLDRRADGTLPGEGAAAVVIKRWEDARRDGDRIYAVVRGLADARRGEPYGRDGLAAACTRALGDSLAAAQTPPDSIGYIETHGSGRPQEDGAEFEAIRQVFAGRTAPLALGALKACLGHSGAAAGLAGLVKAALCLYQQILPPLPHFQQAPEGAMDTESIHIPIQPIFWPLNQAHQPRRACLNALTPEGNAVAVVLEEAPDDPKARHDVLRLAPTGVPDQGLFLIEGRDHAELERTLASLATHLRQSRSAGQSIGIAARQWLRTHPPEAILPCAMAFSFSHHRDFDPLREAARSALANGRALSFAGLEGGHFSPQPLGPSAPPVLVYPGSGNHYVGMGRQFSVQWPEIWRRANRRSDRFADQCRFARLMPYRSQWPPDWSRQARAAIDADPVGIICGQVVFGCLTTDLLADFGLRPSAVIGYSLGETVAYFATGAWSDRDRMLDRMEKSDLFRTQLAGPCLAAGQVLPLPANAALDWRVAVVNRSAAQVRDHLPDFPAARLLIINTPDECVIGGHGPEVEALVRRMACEAIFLQGLLSVHCEAVQSVAEAYRRLHLFPTVPAEGLDYYSCAEGRRIDLTSDAAADSLMKQAVEGFDFNATIEQAYSDGQRFFLEVGPQGSCTRMIRRILTGRPHLALTVAPGPADEVSGLSRALAVMAAERLPVRLDRFYPPEDALAVSTRRTPARPMRIDCGGMPLRPPGPPLPVAAPAAPPPEATPGPESMAPPASDSTGGGPQDAFFDQTRALMDEMNTSLASTSAAHQKFLALTDEISRQYARTIDIQRQLIHQARGEDWHPATPGAENGAPALNKALPSPPSEAPAHSPERSPAVAFDRDLCMEFAVGSVARVLGPAFAAV
ncbi:MAG: beta-ketoacyl synthase N-terminal-like domain-containing protein, partial [Desulfobacterales bacterium]